MIRGRPFGAASFSGMFWIHFCHLQYYIFSLLNESINGLTEFNSSSINIVICSMSQGPGYDFKNESGWNRTNFNFSPIDERIG